MVFGLFQCVQVDKNKFQARVALELTCYSPEHIMWIFFAAIPILILWVVGSPALVFIFILKNRYGLNRENIKKYYLIFYQGLKRQTFYWEFVNVSWKIILIAVSAILSTASIYYQILVSVGILLLVYRIQLRINPYEAKENNYIEVTALQTGIMTAFSGVIFVDDENKASLVRDIFYFFLIFWHGIFLMRWLYLFLLSFNSKNKFIV
jgi:hypothetical protein